MRLEQQPVAQACRDAACQAWLCQAVMASDEPFFRMVDRHCQHVPETVKKLIEEGASDLGDGWLYRVDKQPAGLIQYARSDEVFNRQVVSLRAYVRQAIDKTAFQQALQPFRQSKQPLSAEPSAYLLRIFVDPAWRGTGLADTMMQRLFEFQAAHGLRLSSLHVLTGNMRARALYSRLGYALAFPPLAAQSYVLMQRRSA